METTIEKLKSLKIKVTRSRVELLKFLMDNKGHFTAEDIFKRLQAQYPNLNLASVYNNLNLFDEHGMIRRLYAHREKAVWDADVSAHAHFVCDICGEIFDLDLPQIPEEYYLKYSGSFKVSHEEIIFRGICNKCEKEEGI